jgi:AcrR family transcriptional regulator
VTTSNKLLTKAPERLEARGAPRMAAEDRRQQIIKVAIELFSQKGFRGTTTKEAIIDCKAHPPDGLSLDEMLKTAMSSQDDRQVFQTVATHILSFHERDDSAMRILLYSALERHELAQMIFTTHIAKVYGQLAEYVKRRIAGGAFRRVDPMTAVRGFMGMLINEVMIRKFFQYEDSQLAALSTRQAAERFTDIFLASLTNHNHEAQRSRRK